MGTGTWGFVHLSVHKGDLGCLVLQGNDTSFNHLIVQIVTLTGSFSYSSKYRVTSVGFGNIVNQFHNQDSFADSSTTEKTNLTSLSIGGKKIDNLTTDQTLSTIHSNGSDSVLSKMLGNLQDELWRSVLNNKGVKNFGKSILELYVNDGTNNRDNLTLGKSCSRYRWAH